jgi:hypothetical protein
MQSEAELAGVLAHEIAHVTRKHTMKAIQKSNLVQMGADQTNIKDNPQLLQRVVDEGYKIVLGGFGRAEELESDTDALPLVAQIGYASSGLPKFLRTLEQRNKDSDQRQGLFASHPEMSERLQKLDAASAKDPSNPSITLEARYTSNVKYQAVPIGVLSIVENASAPSDTKTESKPQEPEKKPSRFSLSKIKNPLAGGSDSKQSGAVTGSAASRGVDRERLAKGGSNPNKVAVTITDADVAAFIAEGQLKS